MTFNIAGMTWGVRGNNIRAHIEMIPGCYGEEHVSCCVESLLFMYELCQGVNQHVPTSKMSFPDALTGNPGGVRGLIIHHFCSLLARDYLEKRHVRVNPLQAGNSVKIFRFTSLLCCPRSYCTHVNRLKSKSNAGESGFRRKSYVVGSTNKGSL